MECFKAMLPYDRAFDHDKYFQWGLVYLIDMLRLPEQAPEVYQEFLNGNHTVSRKKVATQFNAVSTDMALEQSLNRESKVKGGIIGNTQDDSTVEKWTLTCHIRTATFENFKSLSGIIDGNDAHKDLLISTITKSEKIVESIKSSIQRLDNNPFNSKLWSSANDDVLPLINIVNDTVMPSHLAHQLLNAAKEGEELLKKFVQDRVINNPESFWEPIKRVKLPTFSVTNKPVKINTGKEKIQVLKGGCDFFHRCSIISQKREVDMKQVLSYELAAVPLSLFHLSSDMRKTNKSALLAELEIDDSSVKVLNHECNTGYIIDLMAVVQSSGTMQAKCTFQELSELLGNTIVSAFKISDVVAVVPDRYDHPYSIKSFERTRRNTCQHTERIITSPQMKIPANFKGYLSNPKNKMHLIKFLLDNWKVQFKSMIKENQKLILSFLDGTASIVTSEYITQVSSLTSDHEEADSKMFVFANYMLHNLSVQRFIISSPDTDVAVLCCFHYYKSFQFCTELFFKTGVKDRQRFIPIHTICNKFGATICNMLPIFHCMTGCDSTSSFAGIGKKTALKALVEHKQELLALLEFGESPHLDETSNEVADAIKFVSWLYQPKSVPITDINELRYHLFCQKKLSGEKLPPTFDSFILHLKRGQLPVFYMEKSN